MYSRSPIVPYLESKTDFVWYYLWKLGHPVTCLCWHRGVVEVRFQPIRKLVARRQWVVSTTPRPLYSLSREPVTIVQEAGWLSGKLWTRT